MTNYLEDYFTYLGENEAPDMFHVWCAYTTLSAAIGRRVWLQHGEACHYANVYILLVGNAGSGKSFAMGRANRLVAALKNVAITQPVETVEGIIRFIAGDPLHKNAKGEPDPIYSECHNVRTWPDGTLKDVHEVLLVANEFIDFIRINPSFWTGLLNNIYDLDYYGYRTKNSGNDTITGPYVVLLGGIPTEVGKKLQDLDIINTGLARRTILQYGERKYDAPVAEPSYTDAQKAAQQRLLDRLKHIQTLSGPIRRTPDALSWWKAWYDKHSTTLLKRSTPATLGWLSSKPIQVLKLAMLNSLAMRDDLIITPQEFELAIAYLDVTEKSFPMIFGGIGRNELAGVATKVLEHLRQINEPQTVHQLSLTFFSSLTPGKGFSELGEILNYLCGMGQLVTRTFAVNGVPMAPQFAVPSAMEAYEKSVLSRVEPPPATPTASHPGSSPEVRPSTEPPSTPLDPPSADQTVLESAGGTAPAPSPTA